MTRRLAVLTVALSALVVGLVAYAIDTARTPRSRASAVLSVPVDSGSPSIADNPQGATQLAATYAQLIADDDGLLQAVAKAAGISVDRTRLRFTVKRADSDSSVLALSFAAATRTDARRGLAAAMDYLSRPRKSGDSTLYGPTTLTPLSAPRTPRRQTGRLTRRTVSYLVTSKAVGAGPDAQASNRLAQNYAGLIAQDIDVLTYASRASGLSVTAVGDRLTVTNEASTSVISVAFSGVDYRQARTVVAAVVRAVTGATPRSARISPDTLQVVRPPATQVPVAKDRSKAAAVGGGIVGLLLGIAAVLAYRSRHPRVTDVASSRDQFDTPATDVGAMDQLTMASLLRRWTEEGATAVTLLPSSRKLEAATQAIAERLNGAQTNAAARLSVGVRAHADAAEPGSVRSYLVLVVATGDSFDAVNRFIAAVESRGGPVSWLLITDGRQLATLTARAEHGDSDHHAA